MKREEVVQYAQMKKFNTEDGENKLNMSKKSLLVQEKFNYMRI